MLQRCCVSSVIGNALPRVCAAHSIAARPGCERARPARRGAGLVVYSRAFIFPPRPRSGSRDHRLRPVAGKEELWLLPSSAVRCLPSSCVACSCCARSPRSRPLSEGLNLKETQEKTLESFDKPNPHFALACSECHAGSRSSARTPPTPWPSSTARGATWSSARSATTRWTTSTPSTSTRPGPSRRSPRRRSCRWGRAGRRRGASSARPATSSTPGPPASSSCGASPNGRTRRRSPARPSRTGGICARPATARTWRGRRPTRERRAAPGPAPSATRCSPARAFRWSSPAGSPKSAISATPPPRGATT